MPIHWEWPINGLQFCIRFFFFLSRASAILASWRGFSWAAAAAFLQVKRKHQMKKNNLAASTRMMDGLQIFHCQNLKIQGWNLVLNWCLFCLPEFSLHESLSALLMRVAAFIPAFHSIPTESENNTEEHFGFQTFQYTDECRTCDTASSGFYKHCRSLNIQLWGFDSDTGESV